MRAQAVATAVIVGLAGAVTGGIAPGCRSPTEIKVVVTTDFDCADLKEVTVTVGKLGDALENGPPTTTTTFCESSAAGTVVIVPGHDSGPVGIKVIGGFGVKRAEDCAPAMGSQPPDYGPGCIVARRSLDFTPHTPLTVPVVLRAACNGIACGETETCVQGSCVPAQIPDPAGCNAAAGCGECDLADGGCGASDGGIVNNVVFVTSGTYGGNLGGLAGADQNCMSAAAAGGLQGTFVAYLSDSKTNAISRLMNARGWVRPDGRPFADTIKDLTAGRVLYPPHLDERGHDTPPADFVMTGTKSDGTVDSGKTCADWMTSMSTAGETCGYAHDGWTAWGYGLAGECAIQSHLYCFQIDRSTPLAFVPATGNRIAFASTGVFAGSGGLTGADGLCTMEAANAGLPGKYLALLSTSTEAAASRFDTKLAPWQRTDGVLLVASASDLSSAKVLAPLEVAADGKTHLGNTSAWSGSPLPSQAGSGPNATCSDWMSNSSSMTTYVGVVDSMPLFFSIPGQVCSATDLHVYCLQQ